MRKHYRKKLNILLGAVGNEEFIQLLWATHMLQSDDPTVGLRFLDKSTIPDGAVTKDITSNLFIKKWEYETLANELMTVPKNKMFRKGQIRTLRWDHFHSLLQCCNWLRKLENVEFRLGKKDESIFVEMARIASRQFDWQRGYVNVQQFYRNAFVYGQGECAAYFEQTYGITFNLFSQIGFMLYVSLTNQPFVQNNDYWDTFKVSKEEMDKVLALISQPFLSASISARQQHKGIIHTAYRPSILRQTPCLRFGKNGERVRSPLPELILERITSGVFYDIIGGGGVIRNDYGRRFEEYCYDCLSNTLPSLDWSVETKYRKKPNTLDTPDVLCSEDGVLQIAFECKSSRMSQEAMFGKDPMMARGYEDIIKAVFQLWKFFSHSRRGYSNYEVADSAVGVVLTLDNWLVMAETLRERVMAEAEKMATKKDPEITAVDRKPIVFVAIPELERTLSAATDETFKEALIAVSSEKYAGWRLDSVHSDILGDRKPQRNRYPFTRKLGNLLPWWRELKSGKPRDESASPASF